MLALWIWGMNFLKTFVRQSFIHTNLNYFFFKPKIWLQQDNVICCKCHGCEGSQAQSWWNIFLENYWMKAKLDWGWHEFILEVWIRTPPHFFKLVAKSFFPDRHTVFLLQAQPSWAVSMSRDLSGLGRGDLVQCDFSLLDLSCSVWWLVAMVATFLLKREEKSCELPFLQPKQGQQSVFLYLIDTDWFVAIPVFQWYRAVLSSAE